MKLLFVDTETTGLDVLRHEVIEFAMLQVDVDRNFNYGSVQCYEAKIKPRFIKRASPEALRINGYTSEKWKRSEQPGDVLEEFYYWVSKSDYLVGQNLIFDYRFINQLFDRENFKRPTYPKYFDTKQMADVLLREGKIKRTSLDYLCENYEIPVVGRAHTALTDVLRTFELFKKLRCEVKLEALSFDKPYDPRGDKK